MIQSVSAYRVGEMFFPTIQEAQQQEILSLMCGEKTPTDSETKAANWMVTHLDEVVAILTAQPKSKALRKPRSDIGKKRAVKDATLIDL